MSKAGRNNRPAFVSVDRPLGRENGAVLAAELFMNGRCGGTVFVRSLPRPLCVAGACGVGLEGRPDWVGGGGRALAGCGR